MDESPSTPQQPGNLRKYLLDYLNINVNDCRLLFPGDSQNMLNMLGLVRKSPDAGSQSADVRKEQDVDDALKMESNESSGVKICLSKMNVKVDLMNFIFPY